MLSLSDQLFWIFAVSLVVEMLSQLFDFESMGKIFVQFYVLIVHFLIGLTLASFETNDLIYYFVVLIVFVNGLRYLLHKLPVFHERGGLKLGMDLVMMVALFVLMALLDPYISYCDVPRYSEISQFSVLNSLGIVLLYEIVQRTFKARISLDDFLPRTLPSFLVIAVSILFGTFLIAGRYLGLPISLKYQMLFGYVLVLLFFRIMSYCLSRDPEYYDLLYFLPSLISIVLFAQLVVLGG